METITIITISAIVGVILYAIGLAVGKSDHTTDISPYWDYEYKSTKVAKLETEVYVLKSENQRLNYLYESLTRDKRLFHDYMASYCGNCNRNFYAKSPKEQDVAELLKNITLTSEEIAKKLDIKIV